MITAEEYLKHYCKENNINWNKLTRAEQFMLTRKIPCTIRCFRVGGPVDLDEDGTCPECGAIWLADVMES